MSQPETLPSPPRLFTDFVAEIHRRIRAAEGLGDVPTGQPKARPSQPPAQASPASREEAASEDR